jgi:AcrR family transcriptional regulator
MGKLLDPERTRKAREAREARAKKILDAAHVAFLKFPYAEVTLDTIGQQAGVKQGQASLAYRSREELYLTVIQKQLDEWYAALETTFGSSTDPIRAENAAEMIASSLAERPELTRLLGPLHQALELHEDGFEVHNFYHRQRSTLLAIAEIMARRIDGAHPWDCFDALYRGRIIAAAVHPMSRPVGNLAVDLMTDEHQVFALDLEDEVRRVALQCLAG